MAIRSIEPFLSISHTLAGVTNGSTSLAPVGLPHSICAGDGYSYARNWKIEKVLSGGREWLRSTWLDIVAGQRLTGIFRSFADMGFTFTEESVIYGGVRFRHWGATDEYINLVSVPAPGGRPGVGSILLRVADFKLEDGVEYYIEWCFDFKASLVRRRVDGVELPTAPLSTTMKNWAMAGSLALMYGETSIVNGGSVTLDLADGYILEKTPDGLHSSWLGPCVVKPIKLAGVDAPYAGTNGLTPLEVFNTPVTSVASRSTPVLLTDDDASEGLITFDASNLGKRITGVSLNATFMRTPGKLGNLETKMALGEFNDPAKVTLGVTAMTPVFDVSVSSLAPDGDSWSKEKLEAAVFKIKPV